jgi:hypothetical protein
MADSPGSFNSNMAESLNFQNGVFLIMAVLLNLNNMAEILNLHKMAANDKVIK